MFLEVEQNRIAVYLIIKNGRKLIYSACDNIFSLKWDLSTFERVLHGLHPLSNDIFDILCVISIFYLKILLHVIYTLHSDVYVNSYSFLMIKTDYIKFYTTSKKKNQT